MSKCKFCGGTKGGKCMKHDGFIPIATYHRDFGSSLNLDPVNKLLESRGVKVELMDWSCITYGRVVDIPVKTKKEVPCECCGYREAKEIEVCRECLGNEPRTVSFKGECFMCGSKKKPVSVASLCSVCRENK